MRGYYINFGNKEVNLNKKIRMQIDYFNKFFEIDIIQADYFCGSAKLSTILYRIPLINMPRFDFNGLLKKIEAPDFIYFRKFTTDLNVIRFLKRVKKNYPACKIVIEIPTYPYYKEQYGPVYNYTLFPKDVMYSKMFRKYVDRFVTYSNDDKIFNVKTIKTINGVDTNKLSVIMPRKDDSEIHLLAVAMFQRYHGYERIIEGMFKYYSEGGQREIKLFMVGDGSELTYYRELTSKYKLENKVIFYGKQQGSELDKIYDNSDIGLGTFGFYKIGIETASSLKTKEYLSKGLPIVAGSVESFVNDEISKYYLAFENNETPISMYRVIDFYDRISEENGRDKSNIARKIHTIAVANVSMDVTLKPIVDFILSSK